jgi:undecaprenyl-diphosphatase
VLDAILWGLVQGLTEFLPISSSGHLVVIPEFFGREAPGLTTSVVLHAGTLLAVVFYFWKDLMRLTRWGEPDVRRSLAILAVGSIPVAVLGLAFEDWFDEAFSQPRWAGYALLVTGVILLISTRFRGGTRNFEDAKIPDAVMVGAAQALALIPGISRSGSTITMGLMRDFSDEGAIRFSFLLGVPAIAGATVKQLFNVSFDLNLEHLVGFVASAISGYLAIALLVAALKRFGLGPFAAYCFVVGALAIALL